jgi:hypothetical protein
MGDSGDVNAVTAGFKLGADDNSPINPYGRLDICVNDGSSVGNGFGQIPDRTIATFLGGGNVGIGTTNPLSSLHLTTTNSLYISNTSDKTAIDDRIGRIYFYNGTNLAGAAIESCVNVGGANNNSDLRFFTSFDNNTRNVERMRITRSGSVGIGTPTPDSTLHVNGSLRTGYTFFRSGVASGVSSGTGIFTGIGANGGSGGGFVLLMASWHTSSGTATGSFVLAIRRQYSAAENKYPYNNYNQLHFNDGSAVNSYTLYTDSSSVLKFSLNATIAVCKWSAILI